MAVLAKKISCFVTKIGRKDHDHHDHNGNTVLKKGGDDHLGHKKKPNIPRGFFPVYVGEEHKRYVLPLACLSSVRFQALLTQFEEEIQPMQPLTLPCSTMMFETILSLVKAEKGL